MTPTGRTTSHPTVASARVDAWLWSVRIYKTRALAAEACKGGHVRVDGVTAKPARTVIPGSMVTVRQGAKERRLEVLHCVPRRVGASVAAACYHDHTPRPPEAERLVAVPVRDRGAGRPTKKDRRQLDRLHGRD